MDDLRLNSLLLNNGLNGLEKVKRLGHSSQDAAAQASPPRERGDGHALPQ